MTQRIDINKSDSCAYRLIRSEEGVVYLQFGLPHETKKVVSFNEFQYRNFLKDAQAIASPDLAEALCQR